jgi:hypothetical protein
MLSASVVSFLFPFVVFPCLSYYFGLFWVCSHSSGNYVRMARVKLLEASNCRMLSLHEFGDCVSFTYVFLVQS